MPVVFLRIGNCPQRMHNATETNCASPKGSTTVIPHFWSLVLFPVVDISVAVFNGVHLSDKCLSVVFLP